MTLTLHQNYLILNKNAKRITEVQLDTAMTQVGPFLKLMLLKQTLRVFGHDQWLLIYNRIQKWDILAGCLKRTVYLLLFSENQFHKNKEALKSP